MAATLAVLFLSSAKLDAALKRWLDEIVARPSSDHCAAWRKRAMRPTNSRSARR